MATKPPLDWTRWAETSAGVPVAGEIVEPASGKKDIGWVNGEKPPSEYFNHFMNKYHSWAKFLNEIFAAGGGYVGPVNEHVIVSGTGRFKHGTMRLPVSAAAFQAASSNGIFDADGRRTITASSSTNFFANVSLPVGKRVESIDWCVTRGGAGTITADLILITDTGTDTLLDSTSIASGSAAAVTNSGTINHTMATGDSLLLKINLDNNVQFIECVHINYNHP